MNFIQVTGENSSQKNAKTLLPENFHFILENESNGALLRGTLQRDGSFGIAALSPNTLYRLEYFSFVDGVYGATAFDFTLEPDAAVRPPA